MNGARKEEITLAESLIDPGLEPEELLEYAEDNQTVREILEQLSPPRRIAIVLRYYLDLTEPEIADKLQWPLGTVKRRLHDARRCLRTLMSAAFPERAARNAARQCKPPDLASGIGLPPDQRRR